MRDRSKREALQEAKMQERQDRIKKREQQNRALTDYLEFVTEVMEVAVAIVVLIGFLLAIIPLIREMPELLSTH